MNSKSTFEDVARGFYLEGRLVTGDDVWFTGVVTRGVRKAWLDRLLLSARTIIGDPVLDNDGSIAASGAGCFDWEHPKTERFGR